MEGNKEEIIRILLNKGEILLKEPRKNITLSNDKEVNKYLTDLENYPHLFVLFCIMQRTINAQRAAKIPYLVATELGSFAFRELLKVELKVINEIFNKKKLHYYNTKMAENFYYALKTIKNDYNNDASNIWNDNPKSATIVKRFLAFKGVGLKIATMAPNILVREFKIPMKDYFYIDISVDTHIRRTFKRLGFVSKNAKDDEIIYTAREFHPEYPGIFDLPCWKLGTTYCKVKNPKCDICYLNGLCPKLHLI